MRREWKDKDGMKGLRKEWKNEEGKKGGERGEKKGGIKGWGGDGREKGKKKYAVHGRCLLMKGGPGVELRTERKNKEGKV